MSAVNESFSSQMCEISSRDSSLVSNSLRHQKQANFSIYPWLAVQKSGRKVGNALKCYSDADCEVWSVFAALPMEIYVIFWWRRRRSRSSSSRKWRRSRRITVSSRSSALTLLRPERERVELNWILREICPIILHPGRVCVLYVNEKL